MRTRGMKVWMSAIALLVMAVGTVPAQDVELPLTWKGEGKAIIQMDEEAMHLDVEAKFTVDTDGWTTGKVSAMEGSADLKRFYYGEEADGARKLILVVVSEDDSEPMLFVLDCRILRGSLLYGEILAKPYEKGGEIEKGLNIGDKSAQEIYPDYMPSGLKKAMKVCKPVGVVGVQGGFEK